MLQTKPEPQPQNWTFSPDHQATFIKHHYGFDTNPNQPNIMNPRRNQD